VEKRATGASRAIDEFFGQHLIIVTVVVFGIAHGIDKAGSSAPQPDHAVALAQCANRHGANRRVKSRNFTTTRQNSYYALLTAHSHKNYLPLK
jgi:hypothetical protein